MKNSVKENDYEVVNFYFKVDEIVGLNINEEGVCLPKYIKLDIELEKNHIKSLKENKEAYEDMICILKTNILEHFDIIDDTLVKEVSEEEYLNNID